MTQELFKCVLCEEIKDEVVFTTGDRIGGDKENKIIVCEECLDRVDEMEDQTEYTEEEICKYCRRAEFYCNCP